MKQINVELMTHGTPSSNKESKTKLNEKIDDN